MLLEVNVYFYVLVIIYMKKLELWGSVTYSVLIRLFVYAMLNVGESVTRKSVNI
jgi:uncharacterized membrane protein YagU involved in acid resistance